MLLCLMNQLEVRKMIFFKSRDEMVYVCTYTKCSLVITAWLSNLQFNTDYTCSCLRLLTPRLMLLLLFPIIGLGSISVNYLPNQLVHNYPCLHLGQLYPSWHHSEMESLKARSHIETQLNSTVELSWVSVSFDM